LPKKIVYKCSAKYVERKKKTKDDDDETMLIMGLNTKKNYKKKDCRPILDMSCSYPTPRDINEVKSSKCAGRRHER
jgi:hypothetical protein